MELAFVIDAVRRYFWVVLVGIVLGTVAAMALQGGGPAMYESRAVLLLVPASDSTILSLQGDNERYVFSQIAVLNSTGLAEQVADEIGDDATAESVSSAVSFTHIPRTDIVEVTAEDESPDRAKRIADAYLDSYFALLRAQVADAQQPEEDRLDDLLAERAAELAAVDAQIEEAMAPFLDNGSSDAALPDLDVVAPALDTAKGLLVAELDQIQQARTELELDARLQVASQVVQYGSLPRIPLSTSSKKLVAAGFVGGGFLGLLGAVILARVSSRVLGPRHVEEILGQSLVGTFPRHSALDASPGIALNELPAAVMPFVDQLCVRAEASAQAGGGSLVVVVTGTERGAGATTLAAAMANRFAAHGGEVLLVDADTRDAELTRLFAEGHRGIPDLLALAPSITHARADTTTEQSLDDCMRHTSIPNVRVLGAGARPEGSGLRRQQASTLIAITSRSADVVVIDAGPLMDASASVQLAHLADCVVLAIPERQRSSPLEVVNRQLRGRRGALLPVWSPAARSHGTSEVSDQSSGHAAPLPQPVNF